MMSDIEWEKCFQRLIVECLIWLAKTTEAVEQVQELIGR